DGGCSRTRRTIGHPPRAFRHDRRGRPVRRLHLAAAALRGRGAGADGGAALEARGGGVLSHGVAPRAVRSGATGDRAGRDRVRRRFPGGDVRRWPASLGRVAITLAVVAIASVIGWQLW